MKHYPPMATAYKTIKINVTPPAKEVVEKIAGAHGMTEISIASRIYQWFGEQPDVIQKTILGMLPKEYAADIATMVLKKVAAKGHKGG